jgi:hypothetical protein
MWFGKSPPRAPRPTMAQWNAHFLTFQGDKLELEPEAKAVGR